MTLFIRSIKLAVFQLYITRITSHSNALFHIKNYLMNVWNKLNLMINLQCIYISQKVKC